MARRIIELITSDLSGEEVDEDKLRLVSFTWDGIDYEFDAGPSDEPTAHPISRLIEIARPPVPNDDEPERGTAKVAATARKTVASVPRLATASTPAAPVRTGKHPGPIPGAPRFSPQEYFEEYGTTVNGRQVFQCPLCSQTRPAGELKNTDIATFRQHLDKAHDKALWAVMAKRTNRPIPAGYENRA